MEECPLDGVSGGAKDKKNLIINVLLYIEKHNHISEWNIFGWNAGWTNPLKLTDIRFVTGFYSTNCIKVPWSITTWYPSIICSVRTSRLCWCIIIPGGRIYRLVPYQMNLVCLRRQFKFRTELYPLAWLKAK